ncbi:MAG: response regulator, partial [Deltaproteobacteria bacterium]|nr:response regulator [Deltaproteobacteria bacterium]
MMKKKIMVVDNHPLVLKFISQLLEKEGYQVVTAEDGLSALEILKTFDPDIIFIDLIMPHIGGEKLCQIIRKNPKLNETYLIILSAIAAEQEVDFSGFGANACIAKGSLDKMTKHILTAIEQAGRRSLLPPPLKPIGLDDVYARHITSELLSVKKHFEVVLNSMVEGILEITLEGKIVYANPMATSLIHKTEDEILSSDVLDLFPESVRESIRKEFQDMSLHPK